MHIEAVGAAVDLRCTDLDEMDEGLLKARSGGYRCGSPLLHKLRSHGKKIVGVHDSLPSVGFDTMTSQRLPV
jgi:hypothetical protein